MRSISKVLLAAVLVVPLSTVPAYAGTSASGSDIPDLTPEQIAALPLVVEEWQEPLFLCDDTTDPAACAAEAAADLRQARFTEESTTPETPDAPVPVATDPGDSGFDASSINASAATRHARRSTATPSGSSSRSELPAPSSTFSTR